MSSASNFAIPMLSLQMISLLPFTLCNIRPLKSAGATNSRLVSLLRKWLSVAVPAIVVKEGLCSH